LQPDFRSVAETYRAATARSVRLPAIMREDNTLSHLHLWDASCSFARRLRDHGVGRASTVALNSGDVLAVLATLLATSLLGAKFIVASKTVARTKIIRPTHFFRTREAEGKRALDFQIIDESWLPTETTHALPDDFEGPASLDEHWLYVHTTGTTGKPKFIALSERIVLARSVAVAADFPYRETTLATSFSVTSRPFLARAIAALLNAGAICDGKDIAFWKKSGVNLVCGAPGQLEHLFKDAPPDVRFEKVESSGAHLPEWLIPKLFCHFGTVVDVYGATETNKSFETVYTMGPDGTVLKQPRMRDSEIEILSPDGEPLGPGKIGSVRVRNAYLAKGYLNDLAATEASFRHGWFHPGDLAAWGETGELIIVGREDDVINFGGYKMNAGMLDMFFKRIPGIRDAIAFNNPKIDSVNKVLVFAVFEDEQRQHEVIAAACDLAVKQMGFLMIPSCIRPVKAIPRTEAGDPDRLACRKMVARRAEIDIDDAG
jgi:long-chain acyl-CoA synthetase